MSLGALATRKQIPEPEMGCFSCFGSKKLEKVSPKRDDDRSGSQVKRSASDHQPLSKTSSGKSQVHLRLVVEAE
jgi:hypothetical protein